MSDPQVPSKFLHFATVGNVVIVFPNEEDAIQAQSALQEERQVENDIPLFRSAEIIAEIQERNAHKTPLESIGIGFESESMDQFLEMAEQGCCFLTIQASSQQEHDAIRTRVEAFHPRLIRHFGSFTINDMATSNAEHDSMQ